jgi:hypothetical protein
MFGQIFFRNCVFDSNDHVFSDYSGFLVPIESCDFINNTICVSNSDKKIVTYQ